MSHDQSPYEPPGSPFSSPGIPPKQFGYELSSDAKTFGMLCHLLGPITGFIGPLIIWLIKKDEIPFVDDQGKESLNFQITLMIAFFVSGLLTMVCIGYFMVLALVVIDWVFAIMGCVAANKGEAYRYPLTIRLIQ